MFGPGIGLRIRMYVALALNAVLLLVLLAVAVALFTEPGGWAVVVMFVMFALAGVAAGRQKRPKGRPDPAHVERAERARSRLAIVADMPAPRVSVEPEAVPLSWTTAVPTGTPRVHVTTGAMERLGDAELEAVIAHELSHIANRDAVVMTVLAAPGVSVLRGLRLVWHDPDRPFLTRLGLVMFSFLLVPPALVSAGLARIVSRHRELAADHGAALLTGSPAAMASALAKLSGDVAGFPKRDLRVAAARDLLHVVPVRPARGIRRLWATHPPLEARLRELERLESRLQGENLTVMTSPSAMG
jgi:heat shock protein HtpX